ncbi:BglG family transcription antiterminator [Sporolactobacillus vineae]|uniref:BglG family transcription antiterminator n=1 Tax=Sporolactobacillus vineae TaxID=444463 RepID=UPI00028953D0|nr:BglG family transcription antiterminator [Sporolactobacillus vineae]
MFVTNREKTIIELLIKTSGRHTPSSIATYLRVSVRTVHRDLNKIENTLEQFDLQLVHEDNNNLHIEGSDRSIFKLIQTLAKVKPMDLPVKERRLCLLLQLLDAKGPQKTVSLASDLTISVATLLSDLDELSGWMKEFQVSLSRKRGVGIQIEGAESDRRIALANYYLHYFNQEMMDAIFHLRDEKVTEDRLILHYFRQDYLWEADRAIRQNIKDMYAELADNDYMGFLTQVCITLQRYHGGNPLTLPNARKFGQQGTQAILPFVDKVSTIIGERLSIHLPAQEKMFLSMILKGSRLRSEESVHFDSAATGRAIRQLILQVSAKVNVDLTDDFSLFQGLMAHIEPSLFRIREKLPAFNPLTEQVRDRFPDLFAIIAECLKQVFKQVSFPDDEIAYVVLHFGSALEQRKQDVKLRALVVCPTGIGASKMLASRLRKEFPEFLSVSVSSISEMKRLELEQYDLILSTVHLPKQVIPCMFVNPLLSKKDADDIHSTTRHLVARKKLIPVVRPSSEPALMKPAADEGPAPSLEHFMDAVDHVQLAIREIMAHFTVYRLKAQESKEQVIRKAAELLQSQGVVSDADRIAARLLAREKLAGLAIPGTTMALFHCRDQAVKSLTFEIVRSDRYFVLNGMDEEKLPVNNFLILLAPEPTDQFGNEVIGRISASLVEDKESILVFTSANEKVVREKLEDIFYQYLLNKFSKD